MGQVLRAHHTHGDTRALILIFTFGEVWIMTVSLIPHGDIPHGDVTGEGGGADAASLLIYYSFS